jgi:hypothetical protein
MQARGIVMAEMIPDRLPKRSSAGEKRLFSILQRLPDDVIVYYEPLVDDCYPDFVVIAPTLGLLIIEVRGWRIGDILAVEPEKVLLKEFGKEVQRAHPIPQAKSYKEMLIERSQSLDFHFFLLKKEKQRHQFLFPFGHFALLPYITQEQLTRFPKGDLTSLFPPQSIVTKTVLDLWEDESLATEDLMSQLSSYFDPFWDFGKLTKNQIKALRAVLHPEILLGYSHSSTLETETQDPETAKVSSLEETVSLKVLDLKQEQNARNIGSGHRIIYGVAGSGKTILLIARARILSKQDPEASILILCYNLTLAAYLRSTLLDCPNVKVFHFDGWARENRVLRQDRELDEEFGERFLTALKTRTAPDTQVYDAVLIDESQDFEPSWFKCVLEAMKDREEGDLVIVGDGNQGLYRRNKIRWSEIGITARGRTISAKFDLDKNYRNTRQILEIASSFASPDTVEDEDGIRSLQVDPAQCPRTGMRPVLVRSKDKAEECKQIIEIVQNLLQGLWFGHQIPALRPKDIAIFYARLTRKDEEIFRSFVTQLNQNVAPTTWLTEKGNYKARLQIADETVKIQTIHSAKGLQYRAVIMLWTNDLPATFADSDEQVERQLFYVALTRPEDYLVLSYSGKSIFITEIEQSGKIQVV